MLKSKVLDHKVHFNRPHHHVIMCVSLTQTIVSCLLLLFGILNNYYIIIILFWINKRINSYDIQQSLDFLSCTIRHNLVRCFIWAKQGKGRKEGRKCFIYRRTQHILFTVIWRQTYGKGPLRWQERKPAAPYGLLFPISSFICIRQDNTYNGLCYTGKSVRSWCDGSSNRSFMG